MPEEFWLKAELQKSDPEGADEELPEVSLAEESPGVGLLSALEEAEAGKIEEEDADVVAEIGGTYGFFESSASFSNVCEGFGLIPDFTR